MRSIQAALIPNFKYIFLVFIILFTIPLFAQDSTALNVLESQHQILCPIAPDLNDPNQCQVVEGTQIGTDIKTYNDPLGFYSGSYVYTSFNALCEGHDDYNVFSGFISLGSRWATGNITPVNYHDQYKNYYCCKRIARWVETNKCVALK